MPDQNRSGDKFHVLSAIDSKLAELERKKQRLITLRAELQNSKTAPPISDSFSPEQKIAIFRNLFRGRTDIFADRWQNQRGRSGYSVACDNEWVQGVCNKPRIKCLHCTHHQFSELTDQIIYRHLAGQPVVGLSPLLHDNTCYLLAAEFDKDSWQNEIKAMSKACTEYGVPHAVEISRSGNGAHLWIFFDDKRELGIILSSMKPLLALRKNQQAIVKEMSKCDAGILHAPTAFGKTVTATGMITKRKVNTLILVHSRQLLDQ